MTYTRTDGTFAPCNGVNHRDMGEIVKCDRCGAQVAKRDDGKVFTVRRVGKYGARKYSCWADSHWCNPELVELQSQIRAESIAAGNIEKGCTVVVFKGRKYAKGTTGKVFWLGTCNYSGKDKLGFRTEMGETVWILAEHCKLV